MRRGPDRCFYIVRHPCETVLFDSHFKKSDKNRCGSRSPDLEPPTISSNPGSLGFLGCALLALLRPVPPTLALSSQRSRSVPRPCVLDVEVSHSPGAVRAGNVPALGSWVQTDQYCNPIPGSPLWALALGTRSLLSCGQWFLTPHWRYPQSALGRWRLWLLGRSVLKPKLLFAGLLSFVSTPALLHKVEVISEFHKFHKTTVSESMPSLASETID